MNKRPRILTKGCGHKKSAQCDCSLYTCANKICNKEFWSDPFSTISRVIMKQLPTCSYECNKEIGQIR